MDILSQFLQTGIDRIQEEPVLAVALFVIVLGAIYCLMLTHGGQP